MRSDRTLHILKETALTLGAILGVVCLLAAAAAMFFGIRPLVFRSGSMSPEIHTGALALARTTPASELRVGDVVSAPNSQGTRVTHRVVAIAEQPGGIYAITMKGDANAEADTDPYLVTEAERVFWHVEGVGFLVQEVQKPPYVFAAGVAVGALLVLSVRVRRRNRANDEDAADAAGPTDRGSLTKAVALAVVPVLLIAVTVTGSSRLTTAAFTDMGLARSADISTLANPFPPVGVTCTTVGSLGAYVRLNWTTPSVAPSGYVVTITDANGASRSTSLPAGTVTANVTTGLLGLGLLSVGNFTIVVKSLVFTNWVGTSPAIPVNATVLGGLQCGSA